MPLSSRVIKGEDSRLTHQVHLRRLVAVVDDSVPPSSLEFMETAKNEAAQLLERASLEAAQVVEEAGRQAREMREGAREEARELREEARQAGYAAGLAAAAEESREVLARAEQVLSGAHEERKTLLAGITQELADLALAIAQKVVARELTQSPAAVMAVAREALGLVNNRERVTVYVNPAEADLFRARRGDLEGSLSDRAVLVIIADAEVPAGGVRVETEQGLVDASLEARFAPFYEALKVDFNRGAVDSVSDVEE